MPSFLYVKSQLNNLNTNRIRIIVSLKVSKKAVQRNKIKRRIRAVFRELEQKIKKGYDIIIITNQMILNQDYKNIKSEIESQLSRLKLNR